MPDSDPPALCLCIRSNVVTDVFSTSSVIVVESLMYLTEREVNTAGGC